MSGLTRPLPIRLSLPLVVALTSLTIIAVSLLQTDRMEVAELRRLAEHHARDDAGRLARLAERDLRQRPAEVQQEIIAHGTEHFPGTPSTWILAPDGSVVFAHRGGTPGITGESPSPGLDRERLRHIMSEPGPGIRWNEGLNRLDVAMPFAYPSTAETPRRGVVYLSYDLSRNIATVHRDNLRHRLPEALAILTLSGLLAFWLHRRLTRPLGALLQATEAVGRGDFSVRAPAAGDQELNSLVKAFNSLVDRIREAQSHLSQSERRFREMFENAPVAYQSLDGQGRLVDVNEELCRLLGQPRENLIGMPFHDFWTPETRGGFDACFEALRQEGERRVELRLIHPEDGERIVLADARIQRDAQGRTLRTHCVLFDITERAATQAALAQREEQLDTLIEAMPDIVCFKDGEGRWLKANRFDLELFQLQGVDYRGKKDSELAEYQDFYREAFLGCEVSDEQAWQADGPSRGEEIIPRPDGTAKVFDIIKVPLFHDDGRRKGLVVIGRDITEQKAAQSRAQHLAYHDSLTGLPNRSLLHDRLGLTLAVSRRQERQDALLLLNIDRFKTINDARGHAVGDTLLSAVSGRLAGLLREGDTLARLSADEFAIILPDLARQRDAAARQALSVANTIHAQLRQPYEIEGEAVVITVSIGIALFPEGAEEIPSDILRKADTALHKAKSAGGGQTAYFEANMGEQARQRFELERELRQGVRRGELRLYLQPQVNAAGRVVGAEALVRWQHPSRGLVPPGAFIPLAEESDLIVELETWVLTEVCRLLVRADQAGRTLRVAVNISPRHFRQPGFVAWIQGLLAASGADPTHLTLEVTEGLMIDDLADVVGKMTALTDLGIHFSIDDFGTGYSSLAYLKRLPIQELKIDKSFVQDAPTDPNDAALVETILAVAQHLHLQVVAEGVETREQADFLNQRGQVVHQGYLYGKPEPAEAWLARQTD